MSDIHLFHEDDIIPKVKPYNWDLVINDVPYYVARFEGFVHSIGGHWGYNDLWCWPRDEEPSYENLIEYDLDEPVQWGIIFNPSVYVKTKWGESSTRLASGVTITRNGAPFYTVYGGLSYGIDKARMLISDIREHPLGFDAIDFDKKMIGRKVWWRSEPAVIRAWISNQACVILEADGISEFTVPAEFADEHPDYYADGCVKATIFDRYIWWFRD